MANPYGLVADDVEARFSQEDLAEITTDAAGDPIDDAKIDQAILDAASEFDGYAGRYYVTPVEPFTAFVRTKLLDLCAWRLLFNCRPRWLNAEGEQAVVWRSVRKELVDWMKALSDEKRSQVLPGCKPLDADNVVNAGGKASAWSDGQAFSDLRTLRG